MSSLLWLSWSWFVSVVVCGRHGIGPDVAVNDGDTIVDDTDDIQCKVQRWAHYEMLTMTLMNVSCSSWRNRVLILLNLLTR